MTFEEVHRAIKKNDIDLLRAELDRGLDPNLTHRFGATILMLAATKGNTRIGKLLIEKGAKLDQRDRGGSTALWSAVMAGQTSFVQLLLESGAALDCYSSGSPFSTSLDWAERYCGVSKEQMNNIRDRFRTQQLLRNRD